MICVYKYSINRYLNLHKRNLFYQIFQQWRGNTVIFVIMSQLCDIITNITVLYNISTISYFWYTTYLNRHYFICLFFFTTTLLKLVYFRRNSGPESTESQSLYVTRPRLESERSTLSTKVY